MLRIVIFMGVFKTSDESLKKSEGNPHKNMVRSKSALTPLANLVKKESFLSEVKKLLKVIS